MSRTIRKQFEDVIVAAKEKINHCVWGEYYSVDELSPVRRDRKSHWKAPSWYKRVYRARQRAREREALRTRSEIPVERRCNDWNWS